MKSVLASVVVAIVHVRIALGVDTPKAAEYIWPSASDFLESQLYEQVGNDITSIAQFVVPCGTTPLSTGRNINAEWVRTVYHDVATADVVAGTGGVDASIGFEMDRPENAGSVAFNETLQFLRGSLTAQSSMADLLTIGLITSIGSCSGGKVIVPFRGGRIDATAAGPSGVPKPDETIESHTAAFKRMGLNQDEMIGLIACGHTMGGVHGKDFPEIVNKPASGPDDHDRTQDFDTTGCGTNSFDNKIATEFVANVTQNPLAFGKNDTTNSDKRIFNSDGRKAITKLASSPDVFFQTCQTLLEKMVNIVPKTVTLASSPLQPIDVKPGRLFGQINDNKTMTLSGYLRLREPSIGPNLDRTVKIQFRPRGSTQTCAQSKACLSAAITADKGSWTASQYEPIAFKRYPFSVKVSLSKGVSSFEVVVSDKQDNGKIKTTTYTNGGAGFPFDDTLLTQPKLSCAEQSSKGALTLTVAVRDDAKLNSLKGFIQMPSSLTALVPKVQTKALTFSKTTGIAGSGYTFYKASHTDMPGAYTRTYSLVASDGKKTVQKLFQDFSGLDSC